MKKLINETRNVVREMLEGLVLSSPRLALLEGETVVLRNDIPTEPARRAVSIISGGGSGHEPAHAGYVGAGMLSAAVAGDVFTSPSTDAVAMAIRATSGPAGCVLVVKNYTGDRLNFGLAAEIARSEGIPVEVVVVADDASLRETVQRDRRRGIAGTVLVHKVAGAAAAEGRPLEAVAKAARSTADAVVTMGVGLGACTVPAAGKPGFALASDEIEFGLGIHGEKGVLRSKLKNADEIVDEMLAVLVDEMGAHGNTGIALLVNGLGATPPMELAIVTRRAMAYLARRGVSVTRSWTGQFMTALEMPGCSLTLLPLDEDRAALIDAPTQASAWSGDGHVTGRVTTVPSPALASDFFSGSESVKATAPALAQMRRVTLDIASALEAAESELTELDAKAGDGDLGASLVRGATAIRALPDAAFSEPRTLLFTLGNRLRREIAGSSGPFYATALIRAAEQLSGVVEPDEADWRRAFASGIAAIAEIGGAKPGDRTMLDALAPALEAWRKGRWDDAVDAARKGAEATAEMHPRLGRASYIGTRAIGVPDGGAVAVSRWMTAIDQALRGDR